MQKNTNENVCFLLIAFLYAQLVPTAENQVVVAQPGINEFNYLRCWRCDYDDKEQCVKGFDFTKYKHEACDGKCLKAFEKVEARTKEEIEKAQRKNIYFVINLAQIFLNL